MARAAFEERLALWRKAGIRRSIALSSAVWELWPSLRATTSRLALGSRRAWPSGARSGTEAGLPFCSPALRSSRRLRPNRERALRLAGAAAVLREKHGTPLAPSLQARLEHTLALVRSALRGEDAAAAWSEGQAMTLEQAIAYALTGEGKTPVADAQQEII